MSRHEALELLFARWRDEWTKHGILDKFVPDGIGEESAWDTCPRKLLWVLREPNDTSSRTHEWDLRTFLRTPTWELTDQDRPGNLWPNIARCSYGIIRHPCAFEDADANYSSSGILRSVAVMNIKKAPGTDKVIWSELNRFAKQDEVFIRQEVETIDPNIVICGGTFGLLCDALGILHGKDDERGRWHDKVIVGWGHPGTRTSKREYYENIVRLAFN